MNESNQKIEKIKKTSNVALILIKITQIFLMMGIVVMIGTGCLCLGARDYIDQAFARASEMGTFSEAELSIKLESGFFSGVFRLDQTESVAEVLGVYLLTGSVMLICVLVILHFVGKVFKKLKESYSPFGPEIVKSMKIAFVLITVLVLQSSLLIGALVGVSLWCVFQIFEYGCELQQQSDETL